MRTIIIPNTFGFPDWGPKYENEKMYGFKYCQSYSKPWVQEYSSTIYALMIK